MFNTIHVNLRPLWYSAASSRSAAGSRSRLRGSTRRKVASAIRLATLKEVVEPADSKDGKPFVDNLIIMITSGVVVIL